MADLFNFKLTLFRLFICVVTNVCSHVNDVYVIIILIKIIISIVVSWNDLSSSICETTRVMVSAYPFTTCVVDSYICLVFIVCKILDSNDWEKENVFRIFQIVLVRAIIECMCAGAVVC